MTADRERRVDFVGAGGLALVASVWGDPGSVPVVLLPGGGQTRQAWAGVGRSLAAAGFEALSVDLRGHGDSAWDPDGDYGHATVAADLVALAGTLVAPPAVVGASLGGVPPSWRWGSWACPSAASCSSTSCPAPNGPGSAGS